MSKASIAEACGWYGIIAILGAYVLNSFQIIDSSGFIYQILNLTGAIGVVVVSIVRRVKQTLVLNLVWAAVALVALFGILIE